jgi:hypothetical protein
MFSGGEMLQIIAFFGGFKMTGVAMVFHRRRSANNRW